MNWLWYRWRYWRRRVLRALGICPHCGTRMNYTTTGRPLCPECGH